MVEESQVPKNWYFWTVVLEKTLESPLDSKIQPVNPRGNQSWIFIGRTDVEAETPIIWPSDVKSWLNWKDWCWERLKVGGEGDNRGWDGWMASPTQWTWIWVSSGSWGWTGKLGMLQSRESQQVGHDWATEMTDWLLKVALEIKNLPANQCRRCKRNGFNPWVRKIPWSRKWLPTPEFLLGKFQWQRSLWAAVHGVTRESDATEHAHTLLMNSWTPSSFLPLQIMLEGTTAFTISL